MRILHVDPATEWRGGQRQLELLARGLAARGHDQTLACVPGAPLHQRAQAMGLALLPLRPGQHPLNVPALRRASGPGVLSVAHSSHAHALCVAAGVRPVVHRRVDFPPSAHGLGLLKYQRAAAFACVSRAVADLLVRIGISEDRLAVILDGVEPPPSAAPAELGPGPVVLAVGALVDHKDHATLSRAAEGLAARVLVAGKGPLRGSLEGGPLELLGQRDDVPALLARAQVFAHSSKTEGMGQAVAEAMMAGVPVVATAAGGVPEALGDTGLLVPVGDADALRAALRRALAGEHPPVAAARERALRLLSVERMVEETEALYQRVASGR